MVRFFHTLLIVIFYIKQGGFFLTQPVISVVIAVHNNESTLTTCLKSIVDQPAFNQIELICVNDHSSDHSARIADNRHLIWLNSPGRGVSVARNWGLQHARGLYVWFVDADDYLNPKVITKQFITQLKKRPADCLVVGVEEQLAGKQSKVVRNNQKQLYYLKQTAAMTIFNHNILNSSWNKLYARDLLIKEQLTYPLYTVGEDAIFNYRFFLQAQTIMTVPTVMYVFNVFSTSSSKFYWKKDQLTATQEMIKKLLQVYQQTKLIGQRLLFNTLIDMLIGNEANVLYQKNGHLSFKNYHLQLHKAEFQQLFAWCRKARCATNRSYRFKYWLAKSSWRSYCYIHYHLIRKR